MSPDDISTLVFGTGDPGDDLYGRWDFRESLLHAEAAIVSNEDIDVDATETHRFGFSRTVTPSSSSFEGFIPLPACSSHHAASEAFAARRHPARSGGLSAPRVPFAGLSSQARTLLARRASAATAAAAVEGAAYAAATTANIRHAPESGSSDDDEYEAE